MPFSYFNSQLSPDPLCVRAYLSAESSKCLFTLKQPPVQPLHLFDLRACLFDLVEEVVLLHETVDPLDIAGGIEIFALFAPLQRRHECPFDALGVDDRFVDVENGMKETQKERFVADVRDFEVQIFAVESVEDVAIVAHPANSRVQRRGAQIGANRLEGFENARFVGDLV